MWREPYLVMVIMMKKLLLMEVTRRCTGTAMGLILLPNYEIRGYIMSLDPEIKDIVLDKNE